MSAFDDASPRQQDILAQLGQRLGFSTSDLTNVTYDNEIPVSVNYSNAQGSFSRNTLADLGGIINDFEVQNLRISRAENFNVVGTTGQTNTSIGGNPSTVVSASTSRADTLEAERNQLRRLYDGSIADVSLSRLLSSSLPAGAVIQRNTQNLNVSRFPSSNKDMRVKISDPSGRISRLGGALEPLRRTDYKVVFPYTPEISVSHSANYSSSSLTHSNYEYMFYQNSVVSEININAIFTARNPIDAEYVLAVQHFFRSVTKMFYGQDDIAGLPPIVCRLEGHGDLQFSYVPVVITGFTVTLPSDVDYISASNPNAGRVPTSQNFSITAKPLYSRNRITNEFSLTKFAQGQMLGNPNTGRGGFI
jgi:hypothetical protein